ncbi:MAG TPA: glycosyltransferase N-terminal domain-containing protein, partial [Gemmatales bacterium]|nr:glycosyltransferase N-terminal domain-containing protein [Gemmatales bacterium]
MPVLLNLVYLLLLVLAAPWILWRRWRQGKRLGGFYAKCTGSILLQATTSPGRRIWLHAVSVGEVLLAKPVLEKLQQQYPHDTLYLSVTTVTGREVAEKTYPSLNIVWFPFDFSWAVRRALNLIQPDLMILAELELWPNFIREAHRRSIPIVVINGRI